MKKEGLLSFSTTFSDEETCKRYIVENLWGGKRCCPYCNNQKTYRYKNYDRFKCSGCKKQFSSLKNTIFERTNIPLQKWFIAIYLLATHKKGISSYQLAKDIEVTQKTAWYMLQKIRSVLENKDKTRFFGEVELDETYVGGKNKNRHFDKKVKNSQGRSHIDKTPVFGILQRGEQLRAFVVKDVTAKTLEPIIVKNVVRGSNVMTDEWGAYSRLKRVYNHQIVEHGKGKYVSGRCYTNGLENFWSHLKRGIIGVYHHTSRKHLQLYVNEFVFRYNTRMMSGMDTFKQFIVNSNLYLPNLQFVKQT